MPLGATGCDGSGILLGCSVGGVTGKMDQVSAWRFINPPEAFVKGVFVDRNGERFANERLYGAQLGRVMVDEHRGEGLLIIDQDLWDEARAQCKGSTGIQWFQQAPSLLNLYKNREVGGTIEELASRAWIDPAGLRETVDRYSRIAAGEAIDPFDKGAEYTQPIARGPFYAVNCSLNSRGFPCPTLTLGGSRRRRHGRGPKRRRSLDRRPLRCRPERGWNLLQRMRQRPLAGRLRVLGPAVGRKRRRT